MVNVAPSVLAADLANLERDCRRVLLEDNRIIHFDVMDGHFVPNLSVGVPVLAGLAAALPGVYYDVHLMLTDPGGFVDAFADAGASGITVHVEAHEPEKTLRAIRKRGLKAGISLRPGTPVQAVFPLLGLADLVLVMSVEPGFGGQAFMPKAPGRIAALAAEAARQGLAPVIEVDGGISLQTAPACVRAGATLLVAGSAVFGAADPAAAVRQLRAVAENGT